VFADDFYFSGFELGVISKFSIWCIMYDFDSIGFKFSVFAKF